jgi:pimeloyl-ACP methyl ester carboxylesterase
MDTLRGLVRDLTYLLPAKVRRRVMANSPKASLSAPPGSAPQPTCSSKTNDYQKTDTLTHAALASNVLRRPDYRPCTVKPLAIKVEDSRGGAVAGLLHLPADYEAAENVERNNTAAILLSGAGGGVVGPSSIYLSMADKLASLRGGIPVLRLDYRYPARNEYCVRDVRAGMDMLQKKYGMERFILVGWSFGGAPVFTVGGAEKERVVGCAMVASQTAETDGIRDLSPRPMLLLHGTADRILSPGYSENLYRAYGAGGDRALHLFEGDDHALTRNALGAEEMLCRFIVKCAGQDIEAWDSGGGGLETGTCG